VFVRCILWPPEVQSNSVYGSCRLYIMLCASSGIILPPSSDEDRLLSSVINTVYPVCFQWQTDTGNYVSGVLMDAGIKYWRFSVSVASNATARAASTLFLSSAVSSRNRDVRYQKMPDRIVSIGML